MLITNFAAGELAETLFGRTDLPQYFQGVSRLENFDVIPTGGATRRAGMKRIARLEGEGRIIPFLVDRQNHCLLFLSPGKLQVYRNGVLANTVANAGGAPLYATLEEIREVQHAQNYNTMILAHQNYRPLLIKIAGNAVEILPFPVLNTVKTNAAEGVAVAEKYDELYGAYLTTPDNYPGCVTFFNGRAIFAGTRNHPQRVFASRANQIHNFATYQRFVVEKKEYIVVNGTIDPDKTNVIHTNPDKNPIAFAKRPEEYYIDSPFFLNKNTMILEISGNDIFLSDGADLEVFPDTILPLLEDKVEAYDQWALDSGKTTRVIAFLKRETHPPAAPSDFYTELTFYLDSWVEKTQMRIHEHSYSTGPASDYDRVAAVKFFPGNACGYYAENHAYFENELLDFYADFFTTNDEWNYNGSWYVSQKTRYPENLYAQAAEISARMRATMQYTLATKNGDESYYDFPSVILSRVSNRISRAADIYVSFYTKELVEDVYPTPEDGFTFEIASDMSDAIRWVAQNKSLLIGTETGEWVVPAGTNAVNIQAVLNSRYGSDTLQAASIGDALCFFQSGKKGLVEYYIPQQDSNFRANNMAMLSKNMLHESPAADFDFVSAPYSKIFVCRQDGMVATLLYERGTGTFAWGRVSTEGRIVSVAALPGESGFDDVYLAVERSGLFFLERLEERDQVYLDSYAEWRNNAPKYLAADNGVFIVSRDGRNIIVGGYDSSAVVYDETDNRSWPIESAPQRNPAHKMWVGYPYASRMRSMPVLANDQMKVNIIKTLLIRFNGSYMPRIKTRPDGPEEHIPRSEPFTGIVQVPFPGSYERDAFFELTHDGPTPCRVLAINAEAQ
jgi:hypothetical protein